jgi:two-component system, NarL family, nitrate/nitrite response regulator NarL
MKVQRGVVGSRLCLDGGCVDWDAGPEHGSTESPAADVSAGTGSVSVLVVDDSPVFRRGMGRAVEIHGALELVGEASGGEAALEAIEQLRPDVVLLDLRMPDLDGLSVLARLSAADPRPACRVLMVSASLDEEVERAAGAAGAAGCMGKDSPRFDICAEALRLARQ